MATLYIDNQAYQVPLGKNLLETCLSLGLDLPYFCWHPALGSVGACRQCAIKVFRDENDHTGKLIMSCMDPVADHQRISIADADAHQFREHVIEWLMTNHPHDCAVCDEGGACHLQDMTVMTGHAHRRFQYRKRTYQNQYLGPFINHEMNRCIQCYRCVRFYKDYAGGKDLDVFASRNNVYFGRAEDGVLASEFSGNLTEVCPTGVFTDKTLKEHYTRKWDLTTAPSVCHHCSLGCNIIAGERYGSLRSIGNRYHGQVNGYFICDRGRFGYEFVNAPDRIRTALVNHQETDAETTLQKIASVLKGANVIGIGSGRASLQSNFALQTLVGQDHFFHGVSEEAYRMYALVLRILREGSTRTPGMKELEQADAVLILGEDVTNTAPMLALAVRQSVRQQPLEQVEHLGIPVWNDAAGRELIQDNRGPLFIADIRSTPLEDVATYSLCAEPSTIARLGFAVAHRLDDTAPAVDDLTDEIAGLAARIAQALSSARFPVVISGTSSGSEQVLQAAANVATALTKRNAKAGIVLALPECNSAGLALMGGGGALVKAHQAIHQDSQNVAIILENDLYRHGEQAVIDDFLSSCSHIVAIDYLNSATVRAAGFVLPAGTFAESDGTLVSSEGRAQRFFQVYEPSQGMLESWRWLQQLGTRAGNPALQATDNFEKVTQAMVAQRRDFAGIESISLPGDFRVNGQRIPRAPHRYSGRTAILANVNVSEPKPPEDPDSSFSYTMEGARGMPPSSMIPFYWSPGWNSVQAVNKYQQEVGGALLGGDPGLRLFEPSTGGMPYFDSIPERFVPRPGQQLVVPLHHIFGEEELSMHAPAVVERAQSAYALISGKDASTLGLQENQSVSLTVGQQQFEVPVHINPEIPVGVVGLPLALAGVPYITLPAWGSIKVVM